MMTADNVLTLYARGGCWYCHSVLRAIERLGLDVEVRNIWESEEAARELLQATGRLTVPVLRIHDAGGDIRWLPESADIIRYLEARAVGD
ncbi:MAG: glutaredoxin [Gammaproteobacteria bacterium]|nr:glutaredoxin [Gammaproteobacteria bacterium]MXY66035.1 glutaredoxin [Gammaproteobacteria bacterium]MYG65992.1 glutaredoxin [Gammaproteobacteria bacterium]